MAAAPPDRAPLVAIRDLRITFDTDAGPLEVIHGIDLDVREGEMLGIVGESGSGKSLTARAILRLVPRGARLDGSVEVAGLNVLSLSDDDLRAFRGSVAAMIFQDPMTSLNPVLRIGAQIGEAVAVHARVSRTALKDRAVELLRGVGILDPAIRAEAYPHEFSGGMRQRAMIAMAISNRPRLIIADEPTTALDVTVQDQVLTLLRSLNADIGAAVVMITHNMAVVASTCDRVAVVYAGRVVEEGPVDDVLVEPRHPYTSALLRSVPQLDGVGRLPSIPGQPPDPASPPAGCAFRDRCPQAVARCVEPPPYVHVAADHRARCWLVDLSKQEGGGS